MRTGTQEVHSFQWPSGRPNKVDYLLYLPENYGTRPDERWPLILFLHGAGERGNNKNIPVWAFHGAKDDVVPVQKTLKMAAGLQDCGGDVRLTIYPDAYHDSWTATYANPELYTWFLGHRRNTPGR